VAGIQVARVVNLTQVAARLAQAVLRARCGDPSLAAKRLVLYSAAPVFLRKLSDFP
jgi:hypothetical protein